jgi:7,8-dihydropterin-6-yl-methyl-4-(beta-D-ribofuranosyl)aminobenzene 5'-phosphate synthase
MGPAQRRPMPRTPVRAAAPVLEPTVVALTDLAPDVIVPAHCTGWRAQHRLASALPAAFVPNAVGTTFVLPAT